MHLVSTFLSIPLVALVLAAAPAPFLVTPSQAAAAKPAANKICSPYVVRRDGEIIEDLHIVVKGKKPAILINGKSDVIVRNVKIYHAQGPGIVVKRSSNVKIDNTHVENVAAPVFGPLTGRNAVSRENIRVDRSTDVTISASQFKRGSAGVYVVQGENVKITDVAGYDFRGPFPRGQFVQFNQSQNPTLDGFAVINPGDTSWTEDAINSYASVEPVIRNGYIEGVNSPTGIGVQIENGEGGFGGLIENVDVRYWVNGAFMAASSASQVTFKNVRACDGISAGDNQNDRLRVGVDGKAVPSLKAWAGRNYRGLPRSGQEAFFTFEVGSPTIQFVNARYFNLALEDRIAWGEEWMSAAEFSRAASCDPAPELAEMINSIREWSDPTDTDC
ncbi:MAG: right-handed parallel beta-helix repeat-containing protein [Pseudomonadota bacterium]